MRIRLPKLAVDSFRANNNLDGLGHDVLPCTVLAGLMFLLIVAVGCQPKNVGLIGNMGADRVTAFDADAIALQDDVGIARSSSAEPYAMAINPLQTRGYVSSEDSPKIHVVSLENLPPPKKLNTFNATHSVSHLATARQNVLLLVTAGMDGGHGVVSTITMNGNQIDRMDLGQDTEPIAITLCDNGKTLLVAVVNPSEVRKLAVANDGSLSDTGTRYSLKHGTDPADVLCASGSKTGVLVGDGRIYVNGTTIQAYLDSFDLSAMSRNQTMQLKYRDAISAVFSPNGKKLYVRSEPEGFSQNSTIEVFSYNPKRGNFTYFDQVSVPTTEEKDSSTLAIDENGSHLFVTDRVNDEVLVLNAGTLRKIQTLSGNLDGPFSIAIGGGAP